MRGGSTSRPVDLPKAPPPNTAALGIMISAYRFTGTKTCSS